MSELILTVTGCAIVTTMAMRGASCGQPKQCCSGNTIEHDAHVLRKQVGLGPGVEIHAAGRVGISSLRLINEIHDSSHGTLPKEKESPG